MLLLGILITIAEQDVTVLAEYIPTSSINSQLFKLFVVIVPRGQGTYYINSFKELGISVSFLSFGQGTAPNKLQHILSLGESKKEIVITIIREDLLTKVENICISRFKSSKFMKGIAFSIPIDETIGLFEKIEEENKKRLLRTNLNSLFTLVYLVFFISTFWTYTKFI